MGKDDHHNNWFMGYKNLSVNEEVTLIRKRLGWIIFWLIVIAIGVGSIGV